ncbi:hypothetical protein Bca4012_063228 [Brassica carinata]
MRACSGLAVTEPFTHLMSYRFLLRRILEQRRGLREDGVGEGRLLGISEELDQVLPFQISDGSEPMVACDLVRHLTFYGSTYLRGHEINKEENCLNETRDSTLAFLG